MAIRTHTRWRLITALCLLATVRLAMAGDPPKDGWWTKWTHVNEDHFQLGKFNGRDNVYQTCPVAVNKPFKWMRTVTLAKGKPSKLIFDISAIKDNYAVCDFLLIVNVNGREAVKKVIHGTDWQTIKVDLAGGEGQTVPIELIDAAGGKNLWHWEVAYWDKVRIEPEPDK